ncbi:MAG: anhydro-N-acetylmuramic acid kinase [Candidatus Endobugula sp.]|jgi:anhydro-N-acetylmuramic acid kinase
MHDYYIGLMTGTSVDSLDAALVQFSSNQQCSIIGTHSLTLPNNIRQQVKTLIRSGKGEIDALRSLDFAIAQHSCDAIKAVCLKSPISINDILAVGSHGQTIRHYPTTKNHHGYTLQVGDPNIIAEITGITTVADFRRRDIAAGGQGAPLAPAFHKAIFHSTQEDRIIINLGGIANITHLAKEGKVLGYDTGPANTLMDGWCWQHQKKHFDQDGRWAKSGTPSQELLTVMLADPYFAFSLPKSTGRERFNPVWLEECMNKINTALATEDVQATLLELTAVTVSQEITKVDPENQSSIYICGGGAHNSALLEKLAEHLQPRIVCTTNELGVDPDWVEALAFAWLAKQTMEHKHGNLPSVTGANRDVILGGIYLGR